MIFKGTDLDAFNKASNGLTKESRSRKYKKYKKQNEKKREREQATVSFSTPSINISQTRRQAMPIRPVVARTTQHVQRTRYIEKKTILDDIRNQNSSKIVSNIANSIATFTVRCGNRQWDNDTKNLVRSSIALAISEVTNKVNEKPLDIVENIKLFIKVGKIIYKIIVWIDKITNLWTTNDKSVSIVKENDMEYVRYIHQYPRLANTIRPTFNMKYKVGDNVLLNNGFAVCIVSVNLDKKIYCAISMGLDKKTYSITDSNILRLL